jgi:HK97 family phage portal protein
VLVSNGSFVVGSGPTPQGQRFPYDELGSITPLAAFGSYYGGGSLNLSGLQASYAQLYKAQLWVSVLVNKRAKAIARLTFRVGTQADDGSFQTAQGSQYAQLMARPNKKQDAVTFWRWVSSTRDIYGEAIALKVRDPRGRVRELWPMHPTNTITVRGDDGRWTYLFTTGARNAPLLPPVDEADVVHWRNYNPDNIERGLSPLEPLRMTLLNEDASRRAATAMWNNGARPSMALTTPNKLSDAAYNRLVATWDAKHSSVDNWAKTAILEEGLTPAPISLSAEELQYIASRQLNREEICAAYDMPPSAVHILDHATYSNITEQARSVYRDSIGPECEDLASVLQQQLAPDFQSVDGDVIGAFDMTEMLSGTFEQQVAAFAQAIQTGQMTPQEARRRHNLPDTEGANQLLVNSALLPLRVLEKVDVGVGPLAPPKADSRHWPIPSETDPQAAQNFADAPRPRDPAAMPGEQARPALPPARRALTPAEARTVQGRLSRAVSVDDVQPERVIKGLNDAGRFVLALLSLARDSGASIDELRQAVNVAVDLEPPKELSA